MKVAYLPISDPALKSISYPIDNTPLIDRLKTGYESPAHPDQRRYRILHGLPLDAQLAEVRFADDHVILYVRSETFEDVKNPHDKPPLTVVCETISEDK